MGTRFTSHNKTRRHGRGAVIRRAALTVVAAALVAAAEVLATLSATTVHPQTERRGTTVGARVAAPPYGGEPQLGQGSAVPDGPWMAAVGFVRDYALWSSGRLARIPADDAMPRVIRLLERERRHADVVKDAAVGSVRIAPAGAGRYVVTSAVGNFLLGRHRPGWVVLSLPGD
jgi:hypothetical protein